MATTRAPGREPGDLDLLTTSPELLPTVTGWFQTDGGTATVEMEANVKEVSQAEFEYVLGKLRRSAGWTAVTESDTVDQAFSGEFGRLRATSDTAAPASMTFMWKERIGRPIDVATSGVAVRFQAKREDVAPAPPSHKLATPQHVRRKQRTSFKYKDHFTYDLTVVTSGRSVAEVMAAGPAAKSYEIELEFIGQSVVGKHAPQRWAKDFVYRVHGLGLLVAWARHNPIR